MKTIRDTGLIQDELLLFEQGSKGRKGYSLPHWDIEEVDRWTEALEKALSLNGPIV